MGIGNAVRHRGDAMMSGLSELSPGQSAASERLLLREFSHRINNELASAISMVAVAENRCGSNEARTILASVRDQLASYAHVHHSLQMPEYTTTIDLTAYLRRLCRAISHSKLERDGIELSLSLYPLKMGSEQCWLLGLIVSELITNAARHAFHAGAGWIHVELRPAGSSVECCVADNGTADANLSPGRGLSIVEALAGSLHGTVDMRFGPNGTRTTVNFPKNP
jgi:two-component sensor histidine kinase